MLVKRPQLTVHAQIEMIEAAVASRRAVTKGYYDKGIHFCIMERTCPELLGTASGQR